MAIKINNTSIFNRARNIAGLDLSDAQYKTLTGREPSKSQQSSSGESARAYQKRTGSVATAGSKPSLTDVVNDCGVEVRVEAIDCIVEAFDKGAGSASILNTVLKLGETDESKTLNAAEGVADISMIINQLSQGAFTIATADLAQNITYARSLQTGAGGSPGKVETPTNNEAYAFNILKVSYKSPCDLVALSFNVDIPNTCIVCPIGVLNTDQGTSITGAAFGKMSSTTPLSFGPDLFPISLPSLVFTQKDASSFLPAASDWQDFCFLLVITKAPTLDLVCLPENYYPVSNIDGFKNEFAETSLDITTTETYINGKNAQPPQPDIQILGIQTASVLMCLFVRSMIPAALFEKALAGVDFDGDGDINSGDFVSIMRLWTALAQGGGIDWQNPGAIVPKLCCGDSNIEIPKPKKPNIREVQCSSELEILNVECFDSSQAGQVAYLRGDKASGTAGGKMTGGGKSQASAKYTASGGLGGTVGVAYGAIATDKGGCDDNDDDYSSEGDERGYMIIDVALKNSTTVSGFQFDIGFDKFSTASASQIAVDMNPTLSSKGWKYSYKVCDDRFGYDKLVRVISYQGLGVNYSPDGYNILDDEWYNAAQQQDSIPPLDVDFPVARIIINNALKTTCECPSKKYYIAQPLDYIKMQNNDQISNPELYEVGTEWNGPTVYSAGRWWTATAMDGEMIRDSSSVLLHVEWTGIKILNKRVVTNQDLNPYQHETYASMWCGQYSGLLATVPSTYEDYPSYYAAALSAYVDKALHNGLDIGYSREKSKYEYLWELSYKNLIEYVDTYQAAAGEPELTDTQKQKILDGFLQRKYKGFTDDANLDGKFDVADVVAIYNSARMRYYGIKEKDSSGVDWREPPTTSFYWALAGFGKTGYSQDFQLNDKSTGNIDVTYFPNFQRVVPSYCLNTICTSTVSDLCPDICGSMKPESLQTLKEDANAFSLIGFGQRTDIEPNLGAKLKLVFSGQPAFGSTIVLVDTEGNRKQFKFDSSATGESLVGGYIAVTINSLSNTLDNFKTAIESNLNMTCVISNTFSELEEDTITITQNSDGIGGNTPATMSDDFKEKLLIYKTQFTEGKNFLTNLPNTFRAWTEYFFDLYNVQVGDLYKGEALYGSHGASFIPIELRITSDEKRLTEALSYVGLSTTTIDFCKAYEKSDFEISGEGEPRVKVLPGDGFTMCEVFDGDTGAKLTPISTLEYNNFYTIPVHGKITIISHNYKTEGAYLTSRPDSENSDKFAPITMDGGKLITAKLFVSPMPNWSNGKYIEILDGHNDALSQPMSSFASGFSPLSDIKDIATTDRNTLSVGPRTSEYTQNYVEDSSSLVTDADYMLHAQIQGPRTLLVKYNTMKPIKYFSFSIRAKNASSEIESVSYPLLEQYDDYKGWTFSHTFHQNRQNVSGLPRQPSNYANDGYSVVTIYPSGQHTVGSKQIYGVSNPPSFQGMGNLCVITFKENICGPIPILFKQYICPPIGEGNVKFPEKKPNDLIDPNSKAIDNKYIEGSYEDKKYGRLTSREASTIMLFNYDSSNLDTGQIKLDENNFVDAWISLNYGEALRPHSLNDSHRPIYNISSGDPRKSVSFDGAKGLSTAGSSNTLIGLNKWSIYFVIRPDDLDDGQAMTIFKTGNTSNNAVLLTLQLERDSTDSTSLEYKMVATAKGKDASNSNVESIMQVERTSNDFNGWHVFAWVGDIENGTQSLYMDGAAIGTQNSTSLAPFTLDWSNNKGLQEPLEVYLGFDPDQGATLSQGNGHFEGSVGLFTGFNEYHDADMRQRGEAHLAIKYGLQQNLPFAHIGYKGDAIANGLTGAGYLALNKSDNLAAVASITQKRKAQMDGLAQSDRYAEDYGSDRCAAAWVSKNICLDKDDQTIIAKKCGTSTGTHTEDSSGGTGQIQALQPSGGGNTQGSFVSAGQTGQSGGGNSGGGT